MVENLHLVICLLLATKLQKGVVSSTTEAEYIATTKAGKEILWMKNFFKELGLK